MDALADVVVNGSISEILPALVNAVAQRLNCRLLLDLAFRRGFSANHQMLAIVPRMPTVAATGLTTFRAPLFGMGEDTTVPGPA